MIIKKELNELTVVSMTLFAATIVFILICLAQLIRNGMTTYNVDFVGSDDPTVWYRDYFLPKIEIKFISSLNIMLVGYACMQNLFPIFSELKTKTNKECKKGFGAGTGLVGILYLTLSLIGIYLFGSSVKPSILDNIADMCKVNVDSGEMECPW